MLITSIVPITRAAPYVRGTSISGESGDDFVLRLMTLPFALSIEELDKSSYAFVHDICAVHNSLLNSFIGAEVSKVEHLLFPRKYPTQFINLYESMYNYLNFIRLVWKPIMEFPRRDSITQHPKLLCDVLYKELIHNNTPGADTSVSDTILELQNYLHTTINKYEMNSYKERTSPDVINGRKIFHPIKMMLMPTLIKPVKYHTRLVGLGDRTIISNPFMNQSRYIRGSRTISADERCHLMDVGSGGNTELIVSRIEEYNSTNNKLLIGQENNSLCIEMFKGCATTITLKQLVKYAQTPLGYGYNAAFYGTVNCPEKESYFNTIFVNNENRSNRFLNVMHQIPVNNELEVLNRMKYLYELGFRYKIKMTSSHRSYPGLFSLFSNVENLLRITLPDNKLTGTSAVEWLASKHIARLKVLENFLRRKVAEYERNNSRCEWMPAALEPDF